MQSMLYALLAPLIMQMSAGDELRLQDRERLADCIVKLETDPENAYEDGLAWRAEGNRPEARHCVALALIELGRAEEGAARLEHLALASDGGARSARAHYFFQAGNAWILARRPETAEIALDEAIRLNTKNPDFFLARARSKLLQDMWTEAETDLDEALTLRAADVVGLQLRSEARLKRGDLDAAYQDMRVALELEPDNIDTLLLRGRIREAQDKRRISD